MDLLSPGIEDCSVFELGAHRLAVVELAKHAWRTHDDALRWLPRQRIRSSQAQSAPGLCRRRGCQRVQGLGLVLPIVRPGLRALSDDSYGAERIAGLAEVELMLTDHSAHPDERLLILTPCVIQLLDMGMASRP